MNRKQNKGFTLLEILLVIAAIGIIAAIVLVAINPNRQIEAARQAKRRTDINSITKAIQQYSIDNNGQYPTGIDTGAKPICQTGNTPTGCIDLSTFLVPDYLAALPEADSNRYYIRKNTSGTSIEVSHPKDNIWDIGGTPSLDLNFAKNKSLIDNVSGNNLINFTRNSIGTYVGEDGLIKTAGVNEPRFEHDTVTGESLGLLVEESRTNRVSYSVPGTGWSVTDAATITTNAATSPDGTNSASLIYFPGSGVPIVNTTTTVSSGSKTVSVWIRSVTGNVTVRIGNSSDYGANQTVGMSWTRIAYTCPSGSDSAGIYVSDPVVGATFYAWGFQEEDGSFPTSYIPTSGSIVTRTADVTSIMGTNFSSWYNQNEGTVLFNSALGESKDATPSIRFGNYLWATSPNIWRTIGNQRIIGTNSSRTIRTKQSITLKQNDHVISINGAAVSAALQNNDTTPLSTGPLSFNSPGNTLNGYISRLTYWPQRLSNNILQNITK